MKKNIKNSFRNKIIFKYVLYETLGIITLLSIMLIAYLNERFFETLTTITLFFIYRLLYTKQYHSKSLILCSIISIIVFMFVVNLEVRFKASILTCSLLAFIITLVSYHYINYKDDEDYINSIKSIKTKTLDNLSLDEMYELMPSIKKDIIEIVYGYLHRDRTISAYSYACSKNISEPLVYKYVKKVKDTFSQL